MPDHRKKKVDRGIKKKRKRKGGAGFDEHLWWREGLDRGIKEVRGFVDYFNRREGFVNKKGRKRELATY